MADVPANFITVSFPDDGNDPASGGGSGDGGTLNAEVLSTLSKIQVQVSAINGNVRAILDVLRKIGASGLRTGAAGSATGRSDRVTVQKVYRVNPGKEMSLYRPGMGVPQGGTEPYSPLRDAAAMRRSPALLSTDQRNTAIEQYTGIQQQSSSAPRSSWSYANPNQTGWQPTSWPSSTPAPNPWSSGRLLPGAPGAAPPGVPPPAPPGGGGGGGDVGVDGGGILTTVGRVLAVARLIMGAISAIGAMFKRLLNFAQASRDRFGAVDPVIAMHKATMQIAQVMDTISMGQSAFVRSASNHMTRGELVYQGGTQYLRHGAAVLGMALTGGIYKGAGRASMQLLDDMRSKGSMYIARPAYAIELLATFFGLRSDEHLKRLDALALAQVRASTYDLIRSDFVSMTGGIWSDKGPYNSYNGTRRDSSNWWKQ